MKIIPAIDLKDGQVVRLTKGKYETVKVYSSDPAQIAGKWYAEGAEMLHIVDLDGALKGEPKNLKAVSMILKAVDIPVQFGGGLRTMDAIDSAIDWALPR